MGHDDVVTERELFVDEEGRALRASWHAESQRVVLSLWRDGECHGTFSLAPADSARLASLLVTAWSADLRESLGLGDAEPATSP